MSDRLYVATRKGLFIVDRLKGGWKIVHSDFLADPVYMVLPDPRDGTVYAALRHGHFGPKLHRTTVNGGGWQECATPTYPLPPPEAQQTRDPHGRVIPWTLELIWSLEAGGGDEPGALWCGTIPGGLFRSADGGHSWSLNRPLWDHPARQEWFGGGMDYPGIHSICVDPRDSRHVILGVSCGGVWVTHDGGQSWECSTTGMWAAYMPPDRQNDPVIQDPHRVAQCRAQPEVLWVQHHNGVFRSRDGAATWEEISPVPPSTFGFAVAVHPHEPDTAWLVPATSDERRIPVDGQVVVSRTRDGGQTFEVLRRGLPQEHAYDIVFRHALDLDEQGERLALGSTTGSLWISEDQGDSWECLSSHLPPVYCVRFVKRWPDQ